MKRTLWAAVALAIAVVPLSAQDPSDRTTLGAGVARVQRSAFAKIQGTALTATNGPLTDAPVRLRDVRTGRTVDTTKTDKAGLFVFHPVDPGSYVVELVGRDETILATGEILNVNAGESVLAVVKLPFRLPPYAGLLGHSTRQAAIVAAAAAAAGVLAIIDTMEVSPRR